MNHSFLRLLVLCAGVLGCNTVTKTQPTPPPGTVIAFSATPAELANPGDKALLSWSTANATSISLEQVGQGPVAIDPAAAAGSVEVALTKEALFVLTARGEGGTDSVATTVRIKGASSSVVFDAVPRSIAPGAAATLVWAAPGASAVKVRELGATAADGGAATLDLGGQKESGAVRVSPLKTTTWELDADGRKRTVTVTVGMAIRSFTLDGPASAPGQPLTLSWQTTGGTSLTLKREGVAMPLVTETTAARILAGSFTEPVPAGVPVDGLLSYTLELADGPSKLAQPLAVRVGGSVKIDELVMPAWARPSGSFVVQWKTTGAERLELWVDGVLVYLAPDAATVASGNRGVQAKANGGEQVKVKLVASNLRGATAQLEKTTTVVGPASIGSFTAAPMALAAGGSPVTLSWAAPNARRLRILGSNGHTVATARGLAAESGTATVFPNGATTYTLDADNTLDPPLTATAAVTVATPAAFGPAVGGPVFAGNPVSLTWTVGTSAAVWGLPHAQVATQAGSTGFADISSSGARLPFAAAADDAVQTFTPPDFESFVYGERVSGPVTVSTNGFFVFAASAAARPTPVALPNATVERRLIAPFWANLELTGSAGVYWQVRGEAPERELVVQFDKVKVKGEPASELTFQARVHQTGVVAFEYKTLNSALLPAAVVGVQGQSDGLAASGAAAGTGLTLFGPRPAPVAVVAAAPAALGGFLKLGAGYLKATYAPPAFVTAGQVGITEVLYQPNAAIETTGEWFEVNNRASGPIDLNGWTIDFGGGSTHVISSAVPIAPGAAVVLGQSASGPLNDSVATAYQYGASFSMPQPAGSVTLRNVNFSVSSAWNSASPNNGGAGVSVGVDTQSYLESNDASSTPPHPIRCASTLTFGAQTPLQKGSPGTLAGCFGYAMQSIPVSYFDISGTGVVTTTGDEAVGTVNATANPITFFGAPKTSLYASTNGWVSFTATSSAEITNRSLPSSSAANVGTASIFWDDLEETAVTTGNVYSKRIAAGEDPANPLAHWIVEWSHYTHWAQTPTDDLNFQVKFFDNGVIEYHYAAMTSTASGNYADGNSATVWLENPSGKAALISSVNKPLVSPYSAIRFTPN